MPARVRGAISIGPRACDVIRALGKWCQVGRRRMEKRRDGYSFFPKACPLKARQPRKNPALCKTTEHTSRT